MAVERFLIADDFTLDDVDEVAYARSMRPASRTSRIGSCVRYFVVNGPHADRAVSDIKRTMRLLSRDELVAAAEKAKGFRAESVAGRKLVVGAGET